MGNLSFTLTTGNILLLILTIALGAAFAYWTYRHTVPQTTPFRRRILVILRSLALTCILITIFGPVLSLIKTSELLPRIALVLDRSKSMQLPEQGSDTSQGNTRRAAMAKNIKQIFSSEMLSNANDVAAFGFDEKTTPLGKNFPAALDTMKAAGTTTDISSIFAALSEQTKEMNIGAIVLYSDGAFTAGANPLYAAEKLGIPVYSVGLGDSTERQDVAIKDIFTNEVATVGASQPVDVNLRITGASSGERVLVTLTGDDGKIGEEAVIVREGVSDYTVTFNFTPKKEGTVKLTAHASTLTEGETTESNNIRIAYVRVLKNTFRIILFAGAPSSDVSFVRSFYQGRKEIELVTFIGKQGAEFYEGKPTADKVKDADLVILIGYPISATTPEQMALLKRLLIGESRPLLFIPSRSLDLTKLREISEALPFEIKSERISSSEIKVSASLAPGKKDDPIMHSGGERSEAETNWEALAPLIKTETNFAAKAESEVLAEASIQGVKLGQPLILSRRVGKSREIAFTGYGLWQWKLTSFGREKAFQSLSHTKDTTNTQSALDIFLGNATRWLVTRDDEKRVRIAPTRKLYEAGETIEFNAQVYDESFIPTDGAIVSARIAGGALKEPLDVTLEGLAGGRYAVRLPTGLAAGDYTYAGEAKKDGKVLGSDGGRFNVGEYSVEFSEPRMRSDVLRTLSDKTGGKFYTPNEAGSLLHDLKANPRFAPRSLEDKHDYEGRNAWALLALAVVFLSAEWFIRKRIGML